MPSTSSRRRSEDGRPVRKLTIISESPANVKLARDAASLIRKELEPIAITVKPGLPGVKSSSLDALAGDFARIRVVNILQSNSRSEESFALRNVESNILKGTSRARGVPYAGEALVSNYRKILGKKFDYSEDLPVILTDRLPMTWSDDDLRFHARVAVFGFPCLISLSGLIEAPARPREYYLLKQTMNVQASAGSELAREFEGSYLVTGDERIPRVLSGYLIQCLFYYNLLNPFCENPDCLLFNAHWQAEMLHAQVESSKLCDMHKKLLGEIRKGKPVNWSKPPQYPS